MRFIAVLLAKRAVRSGRDSRSPLVNGIIDSLSDDESDVDELETCADTRRLHIEHDCRTNELSRHTNTLVVLIDEIVMSMVVHYHHHRILLFVFVLVVLVFRIENKGNRSISST
jgi:uncharacterized membrane protein